MSLAPEEFDGRVGAKLRGDDVRPPAGLWADIEARLPRRRRRGGLWWWWWGGGLAVAIALVWLAWPPVATAPPQTAAPIAVLDRAAVSPSASSPLPRSGPLPRPYRGLSAPGTPCRGEATSAPVERPLTLALPSVVRSDVQAHAPDRGASQPGAVQSSNPARVPELAPVSTVALRALALATPLLPTRSPPATTASMGGRNWRLSAAAHAGVSRPLYYAVDADGALSQQIGRSTAAEAFYADRLASTNASALPEPDPAAATFGVRLDAGHRSGLSAYFGAYSQPGTQLTLGGAPAGLRADSMATAVRHFRALSLETGFAYGFTAGRWSFAPEVGAVGLTPKRLPTEFGEARVRGRVFAKAGLGVSYALAPRLGLEARYDYIGAGVGSRGLAGVRYRW